MKITHISEVRASERRKDRQFTGDDWVENHFDPVHSHRGKYAFFTNPLGTRAEANEGPSGMFNYIHNVSIIFGWEFLPQKNFYFVFNSVNEGEGTENSIFSKITWTF